VSYKHPLTPDQEYPLTAREILHHSFDLLTTIGSPIHDCDLQIPAYEWSGAGSERGGCAELIDFNSIIVIPPVSEQGHATIVTVGDRSPTDWDSYIILEGSRYNPHSQNNIYSLRGYTALVRMGLAAEMAEELLALPSEKKRHKLYTLLRSGVREFRGIPLLAYDQLRDDSYAPSGQFLYRKTPHLELFEKTFSPIHSEQWDFVRSGSCVDRQNLGIFLKEFSCGDGTDSKFMTDGLRLAQQRLFRR